MFFSFGLTQKKEPKKNSRADSRRLFRIGPLSMRIVYQSVLVPALCRRKTFRGVKESMPRVVAITATGRRNASRTPMGRPPFCRASYCAGSWGRLPSTMAGSVVQIDCATAAKGECQAILNRLC